MQAEFLRYSCQIALPGFSEATQQKLQDAKVLIVGMGGLGCPAAQYLAAAGIGTIGIADFDTISTGNLHRQILYTPREIGQKKAVVACKKLAQQNPSIQLIPYHVKITAENVMEIIQRFDMVVDATDNFDTRYLLNDACVLSAKPLVYGAIYQYEGQVAVWNLFNDDGTATPNYRDLFPEVDASQVPDCAEGGVIPTLAGIIGCMQANEVIKYITGTGELLAGKILMFDAQTLQSRIIKIGKVSKTKIVELPQTVTIPSVTVNELKEAIKKNIYHLVDVRTKEERNNFHIGGEHIMMSELAEKLSYISPEKAILFYCASGKRSVEAVKLFIKKYPGAKAYSLEGGLKAWQEPGY